MKNKARIRIQIRGINSREALTVIDSDEWLNDIAISKIHEALSIVETLRSLNASRDTYIAVAAILGNEARKATQAAREATR